MSEATPDDQPPVSLEEAWARHTKGMAAALVSPANQSFFAAGWDAREAVASSSAPQKPAATVPDNMQDWKGMDGAIAFHLIERHADNWSDVGKMMDEWLAANQVAALQESASTQDLLTEVPVAGCDYCKHPLFSGTKCKNCGTVFKPSN